MTDYSKFDTALLAEITHSPQDFLSLTMTHRLADAAMSLDAKDRFGHPVELDRIFDRRLQALRKAGKIRHTGTKWEAIER